jgi:hypothetical protein
VALTRSICDRWAESTSSNGRLAGDSVLKNGLVALVLAR